jgi:hypothetical protein
VLFTPGDTPYKKCPRTVDMGPRNKHVLRKKKSRLSRARRVTRKKMRGGSGTIDIVISRYSEKLDWLKDFPAETYKRVFIYNKNPKPFEEKIDRATIENLPNIGREAHSYLYHVIKHYDNLADATLFLPGSVRGKPWKDFQLYKIRKSLDNGPGSYIVRSTRPKGMEKDFQIDSHELSNSSNKNLNNDFKLHPSPIRPLSKWMEHYMPGEDMYCLGVFGTFSATKEDIRKRPKSFYEELIKTVDTTNPEAVHYMERLWANIFSIPEDNCLNREW